MAGGDNPQSGNWDLVRFVDGDCVYNFGIATHCFVDLAPSWITTDSMRTFVIIAFYFVSYSLLLFNTAVMILILFH